MCTQLTARGNVFLNLLRPSVVAVVVPVLLGAVVSAAGAQSTLVLNGRVVDSAGVGRRASISIKSASTAMRPIGSVPEELGHAMTDSGGHFHITLSTLPERIVIQAAIDGGVEGHTDVDSGAVRASATHPIIVRVGAPHALAAVQVKARYQKRPDVFDYFAGEPSTRTENVNPTGTWFDPLSAGGADAILRASPNMMVGADGSASLMGASSSSNQLQIGGMRVPGGLLTGLNGAELSFSPWDVTNGGAAGATVNLSTFPAGPYRSNYVTVRSGAGGVPSWANAPGQSGGVDVPVQVSGGSSGPIGKLGYSLTGFLQRDDTGIPQWDRTLGAQQRDVLDSLSGLLGTPTVAARQRASEGGVIARADLVPYSSHRILAVTSAFTRSVQSDGARGGYRTGSLGTNAVQDVGMLELQSTGIVRERVMLESQFSTAVSTSSSTRDAIGPTIFATDAVNGNSIVTGGASPQPSSRVLSGEARARGTWYSRDNSTRFVAQLQARGERTRLGGIDPHSTFLVSSADALATGDAIALTRDSGYGAATASSFVVGPSIGATHDLGKTGSLLFGMRADAWLTNGVIASGTMRHVDISPRASWLERLGHRSFNRGSIATLRVGVGRFTDWPEVQQWADAWAGTGETRMLCSGDGVPQFSVTSDAQSCITANAIQSIGRTIANSGLLPAASNRADVSLSFNEITSGVTASIGAAVAQNDRMAVRLSPLVNAPVLDRLSGDGGRALLVNKSTIQGDGVVGVAPIPAGVPDVSQLVSTARSTAVQWRIRFASSLPMAPVMWNVTYTHTSGRERSLAIASPASATSFVTGPLSAGGDHALGFSIGTWIGMATVQIAGLARSGFRFTPVADRDLNGDGRANDAVFVPLAASQAWAAAVPENMRGCVLQSAGRIAGFNSCTGPWSITSYISASLPGAAIGMPRGSELSLEVSNPFAVFARQRGVTFGNPMPVNATLERVNGFNPSTHSFSGEPLSGFGAPLGLSGGIADPMRISVAVRLPLGRNVLSQRLARTLEQLGRDTTTSGRAAAASELLSDVPPVPLMLLESGVTGAVQLTAPQRQQLQALGARWQSTAVRLVLQAYGSGLQPDVRGGVSVRQRMLEARSEFFRSVLGFNAEIASILTPDQFALLPAYTQQLLSPRMWRYLALMDASTI